jgi:hypothetical protein
MRLTFENRAGRAGVVGIVIFRRGFEESPAPRGLLESRAPESLEPFESPRLEPFESPRVPVGRPPAPGVVVGPHR